jgi:hypothetical protein
MKIKMLFGAAIITTTLAAGTVGAAAAAGSPSTAPTPSGKAFGYKAFHSLLKSDVSDKIHRGWIVACMTGHAQPWLRAEHAAKALAAAQAHRPAQALGAGHSANATHGQSGAVTFTCTTPQSAKP